jgi:hypothetical protein
LQFLMHYKMQIVQSSPYLSSVSDIHLAIPQFIAVLLQKMPETIQISY